MTEEENNIESNIFSESMQSKYTSAINKMIIKPRKGALKYYLKDFFLNLKYDEPWSQPQAVQYCNTRVILDGGVGNWKKDGGKKNPDGSPAAYGDPGREIETFRQEEYDGCFDNLSDKAEGPFRLNLDNYQNYTGPTKCHSFSNEDKKEVLKRANGKCEMCGYKGKLEIDHFISKEKGGESSLSNANALCGRCNDRKCNKEPQLFMEQEFERLMKYFANRGLSDEMNKFLANKLT
jgi:hypothetical protein